jgi:tRNA(Ile)-lysidine synthase
VVNNLESGKFFVSSTHKLVIERNELVITELTEKFFEEIFIDSFEGLKEQTFLKVSKEKTFVLPKKNELFVDENQLQYPLVIRGKRGGDKFKPFGMKGFKLLSDFLKDEKLSVAEKENVKLLVNANGQIIWVMGYRSDERYRLSANFKKLIKITFLG